MIRTVRVSRRSWSEIWGGPEGGKRRKKKRQLIQEDLLGIRDVDESVLVRGVLEEIPVVTSLLHGFGVQSVRFLPVLLPRQILVDEVRDGRVLALLGDELVEQYSAEEDGNCGDGSFLQSPRQWYCPLAKLYSHCGRPWKVRRELFHSGCVPRKTH